MRRIRKFIGGAVAAVVVAAASLALETPAAAQTAQLPASGEEATSRLAASPRHGEWTMIRTGGDSIRAWVVYPERSEPAPVVLVVHEIFGLSNWIRAVADQLAADGFVAIAPDLLTMRDVPRAPDGESDAAVARAQIQTLDRADVNRWMTAVAEWGMALPSTTQRFGVVGFCWGGSTVFSYATASPSVAAVVVYYGGSPEPSTLSSVRAPILGLYGGEDARVNRTIEPAQQALGAAGKTYEPKIFEGAGHGFLRQQTGANLEATRQAWPLTIEWFRTHLAER